MKKTDAICNFLALLVQLILVDRVSIDYSIIYVDFPTLHEHDRVFEFKRKFIFNLDVTNGKTVL